MATKKTADRAKKVGPGSRAKYANESDLDRSPEAVKSAIAIIGLARDERRENLRQSIAKIQSGREASTVSFPDLGRARHVTPAERSIRLQKAKGRAPTNEQIDALVEETREAWRKNQESTIPAYLFLWVYDAMTRNKRNDPKMDVAKNTEVIVAASELMEHLRSKADRRISKGKPAVRKQTVEIIAVAMGMKTATVDKWMEDAGM